MDKEQILYNRAIDNLTYLVLNYSKPVQELLGYHNVFFKGNPSKEQLISEIVEQIKLDNTRFISSLEKLMIRFSSQENDPFWGVLAKGALGIVGGLIGKKKRRRSGSSAGAGAVTNAVAQANAAKRDMERRLREMQAQQARERREAELRRQEAERQRLREAKEARERAEAEKKKTNMMIGIGVGVVFIGVILVIALKPKPQPQIPSYAQYPPMPPVGGSAVK
ncbi:hypothetical protein KAOT1_00610 [Kordia algicida OT-1]|uniref:Uncharacterized protein n=1 Tax=Kordia algicida OT-1 TaxID=391587 RepID=A9EA38_9FLAO|nr:hypothetical protein KAOT1_00610 [Kordia algicida OT-1]